MELEKLTALQLADKIKKHEVSVLDGVKDVFSKIEEKDNRIHAYLELIPVLLPVFPLLSKIIFVYRENLLPVRQKFWKDLFPSIRQR